MEILGRLRRKNKIEQAAEAIHRWTGGSPAGLRIFEVFKVKKGDIEDTKEWLENRGVPILGESGADEKQVNQWWADNWRRIHGQIDLLTQKQK